MSEPPLATVIKVETLLAAGQNKRRMPTGRRQYRIQYGEALSGGERDSRDDIIARRLRHTASDWYRGTRGTTTTGAIMIVRDTPPPTEYHKYTLISVVLCGTGASIADFRAHICHLKSWHAIDIDSE